MSVCAALVETVAVIRYVSPAMAVPILCKTCVPEICGEPIKRVADVESNPLSAAIDHATVEIVSPVPSMAAKSKVNVAFSSAAGSSGLKSCEALGIG